MTIARNPGRIAGLWYLLLVILGPLPLMYIPARLYVRDNAALTAQNIAAHQLLFRLGIVVDLLQAIVLIFLTLALYRLFQAVDRLLAVQVILFGGVMPALINFVGVVSDAAALMIVRGAGFLHVFSKPQQDALVLLFIRLRDHQNTAAELLWGVWLFPLALLVYRSRFMPRFLSIWLTINGVAYVILSLAGELVPQYNHQLFLLAQPALLGELAFMLWLVIKGAGPVASKPLAPAKTALPVPSLLAAGKLL